MGTQGLKGNYYGMELTKPLVFVVAPAKFGEMMFVQTAVATPAMTAKPISHATVVVRSPCSSNIRS